MYADYVVFFPHLGEYTECTDQAELTALLSNLIPNTTYVVYGKQATVTQGTKA